MAKSKVATSVTKNKGLTGREKILVGVIAVVVVIAVVFAASYFINKKPDNAAAKVGDSYILEDRVTTHIQEWRTNYGFASDAAFAEYLDYVDMTPSEFRERAINDLATRDLITARAKQLGLSVSDEEVEARYEEIRGDNDDSEGSIWAATLQGAGLTKEMLLERYRYNLLQDKVLEAEVSVHEASDDDVVTYVTNYLVGTSQYHISHIVITGDDAKARAEECSALLTEAQNKGTLNAETFASIARQYSDEENVQTTGGVVGWTGCGEISEEVLSALTSDDEATAGKGDLLGILSNESTPNTYELAYVDDVFTFPSASDITDVASIGAPDELLESVRLGAVYITYQNDCKAYLESLRKAAGIVIYPMPSGLPYDVSASSTGSSSK